MHEIMSISRLRMGTDGPGVSTLIGFHGCPLHCTYCINQPCHDEAARRAVFEPRKLYEWVALDAIYFRMTGGGVVFGGGEPLPHSEFIHEFAAITQKEWPIRLETSLYSDERHIIRLAEDIDRWIIDIKSVDPDVYHDYTGGDNALVLHNLRKLLDLVGQERVYVRVPLIPDFNTPQAVQNSVTALRKFVRNVRPFEYVVPAQNEVMQS